MLLNFLQILFLTLFLLYFLLIFYSMSIDRDIQEKVSLYIGARSLPKMGTFRYEILKFIFVAFLFSHLY